jgi:hypothetical protein
MELKQRDRVNAALQIRNLRPGRSHAGAVFLWRNRPQHAVTLVLQPRETFRFLRSGTFCFRPPNCNSAASNRWGKFCGASYRVFNSLPMALRTTE